jgi:hypothetical protein
MLTMNVLTHVSLDAVPYHPAARHTKYFSNTADLKGLCIVTGRVKKVLRVLSACRHVQGAVITNGW